MLKHDTQQLLQGGSAGTLAHAAAYISRCVCPDGTPHGQDDDFSIAERQWAACLEWAGSVGKILPLDFPAPEREGGREHDVTLDESSGRWIRYTWHSAFQPGLFFVRPVTLLTFRVKLVLILMLTPDNHMSLYRFFLTVFGVACLAPIARAEDTLPDKLAALKHSHEVAVVRATSPITLTYVQELQKLKMEYTKAGNLEAALSTDAILKEVTASTSGTSGQAQSGSSSFAKKLSKMTIAEFKEWLATVSIVESAGEKTVFQYDGTAFTSVRGPSFAPRTHKGVEIELGKIVVPFSTDIGVIRVAENLKSAVITYDSEAPIDAKISPKAKP